MQKYDVQQLLRQQKDSIYQSILTVFLAVILGLSSAIIFEYYRNLGSKYLLFIAVILIVSLIAPRIILPIVHKNDLIKIKREKFTPLIILDSENNSTKPIQIPDYSFSVDVQHNWNSVIENNPENLKKFKEARTQNNNPFVGYQKHFDYKVFTDLVQYIILQKINDVHIPGIGRLDRREKRYLNRWFPTLNYWYIRIQRYIIGILRKIDSIDKHYKNKYALMELDIFSEGTPIIFQPKQIQENLFVKTIHAKQIEYEKEILGEGKRPRSYGLLPFYLHFPKGIEFRLEKSDNSALDKIILESKFGILTIEFRDWWKTHSQKAFLYTTMRPGRQHHPFEEIYLEITADLDIKKYAYFPLIGGNEESVDEFFSWGNQVIEGLRKFCDWNYNQEHLTRDLFQRVFNELDWHDWETQVEFYDNFDDTEKGKIQRLLRQMISPQFEWRRDALDEIIKKKGKIPVDQLERVVLRVLRLMGYVDNVTLSKSVETLGRLSDKIPNDLHKNVIDRLIELVDDENDTVKEHSVESLGRLFNSVENNLKKKIQEKVIQIYVEAEHGSLILHYSSEALKLIYPNISKKDRENLEEYYLEVLKSRSGELTHALRFYIAVRDCISENRVKEALDAAVKIDTSDLKELSESLRFIFHWSGIIPEELIDKYYEKLISLLGHTDIKIKSMTTDYIKSCNQFIAVLGEAEKKTIYLKLKEHANSENPDLKKNALESLSYLAGYFPGKEEEIAEILLCGIDSMEGGLSGYPITLPYIVSACFNVIKEKIDDTTLLEKISKFQKRVNG